MKLKTKAEADVNITSLIDCLMQCIIFFMMIMSAQYIYGVAIKFPTVGKADNQTAPVKKEKDITVYVQMDEIGKDHKLILESPMKVNDLDIPIDNTHVADSAGHIKEQDDMYKRLEWQISELIKQGYKTDVIKIKGDMKTYHGKVMRVIDIAKNQGIEGFSLIPPSR
jgi:biopolymer transport protein ExbD